VVFTGAFDDLGVVDRATEQFEAIIAGQHAAGSPPATISPSPGRTTGSGTRWRSWRCARRTSSLPTTPRHPRDRVPRLARSRLSGHLPGQRR
jgi:hypothetical protein